jgi:anti-anti-sigma factor
MHFDQNTSVESTNGLVTIVGEIDLESAGTLRTKLAEIDVGPLRFDLSRVTFMDSTGLHLLIDLRNRFGRLHVVAASCIVERLLDVSGTRQWLVACAVDECDGDRGNLVVLEGRPQ